MSLAGPPRPSSPKGRTRREHSSLRLPEGKRRGGLPLDGLIRLACGPAFAGYGRGGGNQGYDIDILVTIYGLARKIREEIVVLFIIFPLKNYNSPAF